MCPGSRKTHAVAVANLQTGTSSNDVPHQRSQNRGNSIPQARRGVHSWQQTTAFAASWLSH